MVFDSYHNDPSGFWMEVEAKNEDENRMKLFEERLALESEGKMQRHREEETREAWEEHQFYIQEPRISVYEKLIELNLERFHTERKERSFQTE